MFTLVPNLQMSRTSIYFITMGQILKWNLVWNCITRGVFKLYVFLRQASGLGIKSCQILPNKVNRFAILIKNKQMDKEETRKTDFKGQYKKVCSIFKTVAKKYRRLKSIFYKSNLENPSAFKIFPNGPHICALDARKYAAHLRKFSRQMNFPSDSYKK